jgi:hypothetical protein
MTFPRNNYGFGYLHSSSVVLHQKTFQLDVYLLISNASCCIYGMLGCLEQKFPVSYTYCLLELVACEMCRRVVVSD